jgi:acyl-CoA thioesterase FadM
MPPRSPEHPGFVVARVELDYLAPLAYGHEVLVTARAVAMGRTSLTMEYAAWRDGLAARCLTRLVLVVGATGARVPIPEAVRRRIRERDPACEEPAPPG